MKIVAVLCLAVVLLSCSEDKPQEKKKDTKPTVITRYDKNLVIAFYYQDSLELRVGFLKRELDGMKNKEASIQKEFERKSKELQDYLQRNDEKARKGLLSQNEIAQIEQKAQAMQQELVQYEQTKAKEISEQSVEKITSIRKKIEALGKDYCTKNGIQILLIHGDGGQLNFIDNSMNVTSDFIRYLNENQSEIEKDLK
ncbi:MAG: hypothetical protein RL110_1226 [Bacteroidota bacterium]|jgi:outer membrane protein|nr:OmpH family outer membrane protein [Flavobacteriia bacterium]